MKKIEHKIKKKLLNLSTIYINIILYLDYIGLIESCTRACVYVYMCVRVYYILFFVITSSNKYDYDKDEIY